MVTIGDSTAGVTGGDTHVQAKRGAMRQIIKRAMEEPTVEMTSILNMLPEERRRG
jgi:hypothetical protein